MSTTTEQEAPLRGLELLDDTLAYIKTLPTAAEARELLEKGQPVALAWDQSTWRRSLYAVIADEVSPPCGSAMCLAGHAVARSGAVVEWRPDTDMVMVDPDVGFVDIEVAARDLMGLTRDQADDLFGAYNGIEWLEQMAHNLRVHGDTQEPDARYVPDDDE